MQRGAIEEHLDRDIMLPGELTGGNPGNTRLRIDRS